MMNPDQIFYRLESAANDFADREAAASLLEEMKSTVLSQCASDHPEDSMSKAESKARRDERFVEHLRSMVEARKEANKAKSLYYSIQTWIDLTRTKESTERAKIMKGL